MTTRLRERSDDVGEDAARVPELPDRGRGRTGRDRGDTWFSYAAVFPAMAVLLGFTVLPFLLSVRTSVHTRDGGLSAAQYQRMVDDQVFHQVFQYNLVFTLVTVPATIAVSLGLALLVARVVRGSTLLRTAVLSPAVLPIVAAGSVWLYFYQPTFGPLNSVMALLGLPERNWLGETATAPPAMMVVTVWQQAGLFVIFYLAALLSMDPQLREASQIEGAGRWYRFRRVTWPTLMPTTLFVGVIATANSFKQVDLVFVLTQGGPENSTNLLLYYIWRSAFAQFRPDYAAAITVVLVVILLAVAVIQIRL